jgi:glutamate-1-semialdehyde 2,1-aminomutase
VTSWETREAADTSRFAAFHRAMLERGVYLAPRSSRPVPVDRARRGEIDATIAAARDALAQS